MGPGSCVDSERGLIKHEQVIGFHILIPVFKPFLSSSPVSAWGSSHLPFDVEQLKGPPLGPSPPPGEAGVPGARTLAGSRQPAHPLWSGSQIRKDLWSSQKDQYCILNIAVPFMETML